MAGAAIIKAGASGDLKQLKAIRNKVNDEWEFRKICDEYSDFSTGRTVLHHAVGIGHFEICKFLINSVGVCINALTYKRDTPLAEAAKGEHVKIAEFLVKHDAKISIPNIEGLTALHYAALNGNRELVELLVMAGAFIDADSADGTPLQISISRGNVETVKFLLSHGSKPEFSCAVVDTPLICAVKSRSFECMRLLLEATANPNFYHAGLNTLASAVKEGDTKFLKYLLKAKADPNSSNKDIYKPIEEAAMVHNRAAVEILFPVTERLAHYPNWTVDGIMKGVHSEQFKTMIEKRMTRRLTALDLGGLRDASNKDYYRAIYKYRLASYVDPSNTTWISKRSLWEACMGKCMHALLDAEKWIRLKPELPVPIPHHGGDSAASVNEIFKKFLYAGLALSLDPYNEAICDAFRVTLFGYFAWLIQMSSPDEILRFS
ncbi:ankyrin repeat and SOCS box protein 2-like isoform X1 [Salvia divinorum]|uniref:Ankyrin repeat and SOCS box protein 2-like isoform X1 n=1 Tax=Salvia divinorum TaxID=28513 RepID=A0ABD1ILI5_SALDI